MGIVFLKLHGSGSGGDCPGRSGHVQEGGLRDDHRRYERSPQAGGIAVRGDVGSFQCGGKFVFFFNFNFNIYICSGNAGVYHINDTKLENLVYYQSLATHILNKYF